MAHVSRKNIERFGRATQRVERGYQNRADGPAKLNSWNPGVKVAQTSATIPAQSGGVPGKGNIVLYFLDTDAQTLTAGDTVTGWNSMPSSIPSGKWIHVALCDYGWLIIGVDCS